MEWGKKILTTLLQACIRIFFLSKVIDKKLSKHLTLDIWKKEKKKEAVPFLSYRMECLEGTYTF